LTPHPCVGITRNDNRTESVNLDDGNASVASPTAVVTAARIRVSDDPIRVGAPTVVLAHGEPKIQLVREDGTVRAIDITCGCGEKIRIRCDYN
jgi:hypothetical protein